VVSLDGNPVPSPRTLPMLRLAPAERVSAIVEMNNPGVWVLGEVRKHVQSLGMAVAVEYENMTGDARWDQPTDLTWNYQQFAAAPSATPELIPTILVPLVFESKFRGHGAMESWTINGDSYPKAKAAPLIQGRRYRLQFINQSMDDHPLHLHRHSFELRSLGVPLQAASGGGAPRGGPPPGAAPRDLRGITKDVVLVDAHTRAEVEFTADNPGATLFHCHQQNHMDYGFMMLLEYA
jgi:FtsP/CotA-like multicopper oxidase with cupredoxin domain